MLIPFLGNIVASDVGLHWQLGFDGVAAVFMVICYFLNNKDSAAQDDSGMIFYGIANVRFKSR